jgi:chemotaxis protein CheZ
MSNQQTTENSNSSNNNPMYEHAQAVIERLKDGDQGAAMRCVDDLVKARDTNLFNQVGKLTRSLHTALKEFQVDEVPCDETKEEMHRIADATDRLNFVIQKTESAANRTMDKVEETIPLSNELGKKAKDLKHEWTRLIKREMTPDQFRDLYKQMDEFLDFTQEKTSSIDSNLSDILLAQDFQDLTGQVIKKVMKLVRDVETNLVDLVKMASDVETIAGIKRQNKEQEKIDNDLSQKRAAFDDGPCVNSDERGDIVTSQDDVDDLLSSLGF